MNILYPIPLYRKYVRYKDAIPEKYSRNKHSIWDKMKDTQVIPLYSIALNGKPSELILNLEVKKDKMKVLYSLHESARWEVHLDAFFSFYLAQLQFEKKSPFRGIVTQRPFQYELGDIIKYYKSFELVGSNELPNQGSLLSKKWVEFLNALQFLPKFDNKFCANFLSMPLTLQEAAKFNESHLLVRETMHPDFYETGWFKLLSWCKQVNKEFRYESFRQLVQNKSMESAMRIDTMLTKLQLSQGSADLPAMKQYVSITRNLPDIDFFRVSYDVGARHDRFFTDVLNDSRVVALVTGCSYNTVFAMFQVVRLLPKYLQDKALPQRIKDILNPMVVSFYFDVIRRVSVDIRYPDHVESVMSATLKQFKNFVNVLRVESEVPQVEDSPFRCTLMTVTDFQFRTAVAVLEDRQLSKFLGEHRTEEARYFIYKFILEINKNGVLLAYKVLQKDLITEDFLNRLSRLKPSLVNPNLYEISCAQVALTLLTVHKLMHSACLAPEDVFSVRESYGRKDFFMFVDELRIVSSKEAMGTDALAIDFALKWEEIRNRVNQSLERELKDVTSQANWAVGLVGQFQPRHETDLNQHLNAGL